MPQPTKTPFVVTANRDFSFNAYPTTRHPTTGKIVKATTGDVSHEPLPVLTANDILAVQRIVRRVPVSDHIVDYAVNLVRATRPGEADAPDFIRHWLTWGAGPRAAQYLVLGAKARAVTRGRLSVSAEDVRQMAKPVLRHRLITTFNADADGIDADAIIEKLLTAVKEPGPEAYR